MTQSPAPTPGTPAAAMSHFFITGTDTGVGKTYATCALLHALRAGGRQAVAMKPVAAGTDEAGCNEDVERLRGAASLAVPRELMTPYLFAAAVAPHLAAAEAGVRIDLDHIGACFDGLAALAEVVLVEGVGGFRVPLNDTDDTADLACRLGLPVLLVVGLRLGCLNHALLTAEAIARRGLRLAGWIGNAIDPGMERQAANFDALRQWLDAPCLGLLPHDREGRPELAARALDLSALATTASELASESASVSGPAPDDAAGPLMQP